MNLRRQPYIYQWAKDGVPVFGATLPQFVIPAVDDCHVASYRCEIYSTEGTYALTDKVAVGVRGKIASAAFDLAGVLGAVTFEQESATSQTM